MHPVQCPAVTRRCLGVPPRLERESQRRAVEQFGQLMHHDIVLDDPMTPEPARGRHAALPRAQAQYEPFPYGWIDMVGTPFVSLDGSELAYRWRFEGTHLRCIDPSGVRPDRPDSRWWSKGRRCSTSETARSTMSGCSSIPPTSPRQLLAAPPAGSPLERVIALSQRVRVRLRRRPRGRGR
jgi:hypothetical protein